jgi:outer membrane lipoprotein-sorting protein
MDRRDLRDADAKVVGEEKLGKYDVWRLVAKPRAKDAQYARIEIWVRQDNQVPLKWEMYSRSNTLVKTLVAEEIKRIEGRWFITRSLMTSHQDRRSTRLYLTNVVPKDDIPDDAFTVRNLEKN